MVGMNIGDERDINVTFPEDYHAENLAGKPVVFKVKVHAITEEESFSPSSFLQSRLLLSGPRSARCQGS